MGNWRPISDVIGKSKSERKSAASWFRALPRTNFLFDENIQSNVIRAIRTAGIRVDTVQEIGLRGRSDAEIFATGWKLKQMIVTYDREFWDDTKYQLRVCAGILRLPTIGSDLSFFWSIVTGPLRIFYRGDDLWYHTKSHVTRERQMVLKTWDRSAGAITVTRYWMRPDGAILVYQR